MPEKYSKNLKRQIVASNWLRKFSVGPALLIRKDPAGRSSGLPHPVQEWIGLWEPPQSEVANFRGVHARNMHIFINDESQAVKRLA